MIRQARKSNVAYQILVNALEERLRFEKYSSRLIFSNVRQLKKDRDVLLAYNRSFGVILKKISSEKSMEILHQWMKTLRESGNRNRMLSLQLDRGTTKLLNIIENKLHSIRSIQIDFVNLISQIDSNHPLIGRTRSLFLEVVTAWEDARALYELSNVLTELYS